MYYPDMKHIVETDDYLRMHEHTIEKRDDGRVFSHQIIELNPDKSYDEDSPNLSLHVTNGVSHRLLRAEHDYEPKSAKELEAERKAQTQEDERDRKNKEEIRGKGQGAVLGSEQPVWLGEAENTAEQKRRDEAVQRQAQSNDKPALIKKDK